MLNNNYYLIITLHNNMVLSVKRSMNSQRPSCTIPAISQISVEVMVVGWFSC